MDKKYFCFLFIVFLITISCTQQLQKDLSLNGDYYTIDLDGRKESSIPLSLYFKRVQTIILETDDDCLIGSIDELQVFEENIFILDSKKANSLYVFDLEGKFIRKIGSKGGGPGEYVKIIDFTIDTENRIIFLLDQGRRVFKYKLDGTFLHTITIQGNEYNVNFIQFFNDRLYSNSISWKANVDDYLLLEINQNDGNVLSQSLPIKYNKGWNDSHFSKYSKFFMSRAHNPPRYNQMFMDYIVSLGEEITPYIKLKSKYLTTEKDIEYFCRDKNGLPINILNVLNSSKIFNVHCYVENEDFIIFRCGNFSSFVVIFNKKTKEVRLADHFINDLIYNHNQQEWLGLFRFSDSKGAYEILDTQESFFNDFQRAIKNNEIVPDLDKLDELFKLEEDANPVILYYEFK